MITDHGHLDYLTPAEPSEADKFIADSARHAIAQQRYFLNAQDRVQRERARSRDLYETAERAYLASNAKLDGQS